MQKLMSYQQNVLKVSKLKVLQKNVTRGLQLLFIIFFNYYYYGCINV